MFLGHAAVAEAIRRLSHESLLYPEGSRPCCRYIYNGESRRMIYLNCKSLRENAKTRSHSKFLDKKLRSEIFLGNNCRTVLQCFPISVIKRDGRTHFPPPFLLPPLHRTLRSSLPGLPATGSCIERCRLRTSTKYTYRSGWLQKS